MKKMNFLLIVICLALTFSSFVSCDAEIPDNSENSAAEISVETAIEKLKTTPYKCTLNEKINYEGEMFAAYSKDETSVIYVDGMNYYTAFTESGVETESTLFNGVMYMNAAGMFKYKYTVPVDELEKAVQEAVEFYDVTTIKEENFKNIVKEDNEDGTVTYTYSEMTGDFNVMLEYVFAGVADVNIDKSTVVYIFTLDKEGRIVGTTVSLFMTVTTPAELGGVTVSANTCMSAVYDYDDVKKVSAPVDAESYEEMDLNGFMG